MDMATAPNAPTAAELHERYRHEQQRDQAEAQRLVVLRDKSLDTELSGQEQLERVQLERSRDDREPRLRRLQREAVLAQEEIDIEEVLSVWDALVEQKQADYVQVQRAMQVLLGAWKALFATHQRQEEAMARLPRAGSTLTSFPSGAELAQNIGSRMPGGWHSVLNSSPEMVWGVDWSMVKDIDPGTKPLSGMAVGRIRDRAQAYRQRLTQLIASAAEEGGDR